uniref:Peptidase S72 domain-containing protein n=1 Tax=Panagrellus redivivus TaxID=6233 RepID=A0A7E4ZZB0_PANRE
MRVLLTLLILLFFEVFAQEAPPNFSDYGYIPRWQPDLPASLDGIVHYVYGNNIALISDDKHPITTAYFIFEKASIDDRSISLDVAVRRLNKASPCDIAIEQKMTVLGSTTCSRIFKWKKGAHLSGGNFEKADIDKTFHSILFVPDPTEPCIQQPYYYNDTHSVYGVQFEVMDSYHCSTELILPAQLMLFLRNSDNPYTTTEKPVEAETEPELETTTVATAKAGGGISPLIWVIVALALLALLLLLITLFLIYDHFRSKKRIKRLSNMITNMNKSNWSVGETMGPVKTLEASVTVATAVEKSKDKKPPKKTSTATTKTTGSKTAAEDTTEQTSADPSAKTKKEEIYNTITQPSEKIDRQDPTFKEKDIQTKKLDNLVPAPMDTPTERQKEKTPRPWDMISNLSKKISKKQAKTLPVANTQKTDPPAKTDKSTPAVKPSQVPIAKTPNPTLKTAMTAPPTVFYSTRSKI